MAGSVVSTFKGGWSFDVGVPGVEVRTAGVLIALFLATAQHERDDFNDVRLWAVHFDGETKTFAEQAHDLETLVGRAASNTVRSTVKQHSQVGRRGRGTTVISSVHGYNKLRTWHLLIVFAYPHV
jgi:hypothetical protein